MVTTDRMSDEDRRCTLLFELWSGRCISCKQDGYGFLWQKAVPVSPLRQSREALQVEYRPFSPDMFIANDTQYVSGASVGPIEPARYRSEAFSNMHSVCKSFAQLVHPTWFGACFLDT